MFAALLLIAASATGQGAPPAAGENGDRASIYERVNREIPPPDHARLEALALALPDAAWARFGCRPTGLDFGVLLPATAQRGPADGVALGLRVNAWSTLGTLAGCDGVGPVKFQVTMNEGRLTIAPLHRGESLIGLTSLVRTGPFAVRSAMALIRAEVPSCTEERSHVDTTRIVSRGADLPEPFFGVYLSGSWVEEWVLVICGRRVAVPVTFQGADERAGPNIGTAGVARFTAPSDPPPSQP